LAVVADNFTHEKDVEINWTGEWNRISGSIITTQM
jgi:hypothetical protein